LECFLMSVVNERDFAVSQANLGNFSDYRSPISLCRLFLFRLLHGRCLLFSLSLGLCDFLELCCLFSLLARRSLGFLIPNQGCQIQHSSFIELQMDLRSLQENRAKLSLACKDIERFDWYI